MNDADRRENIRGNLQVRLASVSDRDAFVRFNRAMALETENKKLDDALVEPGVAAVFENPARGFYVVAECADNIVAALMVTFEWSDWRNATFWWIQSVYVTPEFRRQGLYRRLYNFVRERARSEGGVCGFRLYVERNNLAAQRVYESLGMSASDYLMYEEAVKS
jgi:GNAT superfamily N-acetyltransferase